MLEFFEKHFEKSFRKYNVKEIIHMLLLLIVSVVIATYLISEYLVDYQSTSQGIFKFRLLLQIGSVFSGLLLSLYLSYDIGKHWLSKLGVSYIIYWLISYALLITRNLNNGKFELFDFSKNKFFEINSLWLVLGIVIIAYIIDMSASKFKFIEKVDELFYDYNEPNLTLSILIALVAVQDSKLLANLKQFLYLESEGNLGEYLLEISYKVPMIVFTVILGAYTFWRAVDDIRKNKSSLSLAIVSSFLFALIFNYTIQNGIKVNADYFGEYIFAGATLFQILILVLVYLLFYFAVNRYLLASILIIFSGIAVTVANHLKFLMRSEPLLLTDFTMIAQLDLIFSFLEMKFLILVLVIVTGLIIMYFFLRNRILTGKIFTSIKKRILLTVSVLAILGGIASFFVHVGQGDTVWNFPVVSRISNTRNITFEGHAKRASYQSLMYVWFQQATKSVMLEVDGYSQDAIKEVVEKYQKRADEINKNRTQRIEDETVIFILNESLADPTRIDGVTLTENILPNIQEIQSKTTSGIMKSDTYGGGTANIETQTLLGLPFYNLSPLTAIYNVEVVPKMATLPSISDSFLANNRYFIHLGELQLYSRRDVYGRLGFKHLIATDSNMKPSKNEKYGVFPSDESTYQNILDNLDEKESQFFSVVTYQNHIPWSMSYPAELGGQGEGFTDKDNEKLTHYVRLVKKSDDDIKVFLEQLSKINKSITVVFYGDHLPGLYPDLAFEKNPESRYLTDYFIWSNKDNTKKNYPKINSSDFPAALLSHTNSRVSPYYALLTDVLENASVDKKELTEVQEQIANDLKLIQYDLISGKNYVKNYPNFFNIVGGDN